MATVTPDQGIPLPQGPDLAAVVASLQNAVLALESRVNLRYANAADRTARHAVGIEGEESDLAAENWSDSFDGAAWISRTARGYRAMRVRTANSVPIAANIVPQNDAVLVAPLEATGLFIFGGELFYDAPAAADMRLAFTWPGAPTFSRWTGFGRNIATTTNVEIPVVTASGTSAAFGSLAVGTLTSVQFYGSLRDPGVAGNLQLQYAQQVSDPGNLTVYAGSRLWLLRVTP